MDKQRGLRQPRARAGLNDKVHLMQKASASRQKCFIKCKETKTESNKMKKQRNMFQMKEKIVSQEKKKKLNKTEITNLIELK